MSVEEVLVGAPARVHLGLLMLSEGLSRLDGGVGLMIDEPATVVRVVRAPSLRCATEAASEDVLLCAERLGGAARFRASVEILQAPERHLGLGAHTQLRLAIGAALLASIGADLPGPVLAARLGRGGTSSIGSLGFWCGGFVVDGGHRRELKKSIGASSEVAEPSIAPLMLHSSFPWRVVIAVLNDTRRIFGKSEHDLFRRLAPVPRSETLNLLELVYTRLVPSLLEGHFEGFCAALEAMRNEGFKRREMALRAEIIRAATEDMESAGLRGVTMSSWGPAVVGFSESLVDAEGAVQSLRKSARFTSVWHTQGSDLGAMISVDGAAPISVGAWEP